MPQQAIVNDIEEVSLPPAEYNDLSRLLSVAEHGPILLSASLTLHRTSTTCVPALLLRPRPRFPPPLHISLLHHALPTTVKHYHTHLTAPLAFPLSAYESVRALCTAAGLPFELPQRLLALEHSITAPHHENKTHFQTPIPTFPNLLNVSLLPFQQSAVIHAIHTLHGRVLLADDMGLGKTLQALAIAQHFRLNNRVTTEDNNTNNHPLPVLVICPATLRDAWTRAIHRWIPAATTAAPATHQVQSPKQLRLLLQTRHAPQRDPWDTPSAIHFVVASYELLPKLHHAQIAPCVQRNDSHTSDPHFPIVIADECHTLRNLHTRKTQATLPFLLAAKTRILISGTPALSRPHDLFPLLLALYTLPNRPFLEYEEFVNRYCPPGPNNESVHQRPGPGRALTHVNELNLLLSAVMIRRVKSDVQHCLPPKIRTHVTVQIADALLQPLARIKDELELLKQRIPHLDGDELAFVKSRYNAICQSLFHRTAFLKIPGVLARLQRLVVCEETEDTQKKVLVFAHHLAVLDAVEAFAEREKLLYIRLDGQTDASQRALLVDRFQNEPAVQLAILSLAVAGTGLTLTAADIVLFAELSWVPSVLAQAEDRAHRIGRVGPVTMEYVIAPGTVDEMMWAAVKSKVSVLNKTVDGSEQKRKKAFDVSARSGKRICISELDSSIVLHDAINAIETSRGCPHTEKG